MNNHIFHLLELYFQFSRIPISQAKQFYIIVRIATYLLKQIYLTEMHRPNYSFGFLFFVTKNPDTPLPRARLIVYP